MDEQIKSSKLHKEAEEVVKNQFHHLKDLSIDVDALINELLVHQVELEMQNHELREAQIKLEDSRRKYFDLYNFAPIGYFTIDQKGLIREVNLVGATILGVEMNDLYKSAFIRFIIPDHRNIFYEHQKKAIETGEKQTSEIKMIKHDGEHFYAHLESTLYHDELKNTGLKITFFDITDKKNPEEKIQWLAHVVESSDDAIITKSLDGSITTWNNSAELIYGYLAEEVIGKNISILAPNNLKNEISELIEKIKHGKKIHHYETLRLKKDGKLINVSITLSPVFDNSGKLTAISTIARDITERKKADEALRLSNSYNRSLIEASLDPLVTIGPDGKVTDVNNATEMVTGYSRDEIIGTDFSDYFTEPEKAKGGYGEVFSEGFVKDYSLEIQHRNGYTTPVLYNASVYKDESGDVVGVFAAARDITERKEAEGEQQRLSREVKAVTSCNQALLRAVDEKTLLNEICSIICNEAGYHLAWVGYIEHDEVKTVSPVAWAGFESDYIKNAKVSWSEDTERGRGPAGIAIRTGEIIYVQDFITDPRMAPWRESALQNGYCSGIALPLKDESAKIFGVLLIYSSEPNSMNSDEIKLMDELAGDLAFGISALRTRVERKQAEEALLDSEEKYRNIFEESLDGLFITSPEGKILDMNKKGIELLGYCTKEEILSLDLELDIYADPMDRKRILAMVNEEESTEYEVVVKKKNGDKMITHCSLTAVKDKGVITNYRGIIRDITESKKAENALIQAKEEWENTFDAVPDLIAILNTDYQVVRANKAMVNSLGVTPEEAVGLTCYNVVHGLDAPPSFCPYTKLLNDGLEHTVEVHEDLIGGDFIVSVSPLYDTEGKLSGAVHVARDITDRKKAEDEIKKSLDEKEVMLREIHHRVKNNLQIIASLLHLQEVNVDEEKVVDVLKESEGRVKSMAMIHEKLYQSPNFTDINFKQYIEKLVYDILYTYGIPTGTIETNLIIEEINLNIDTAIPLGLIINELVTNSVKHAFTQSEGTITIQLKSFPEQMELTIADNGIGLPKNIDFKNSETLGLKLVKNLVNQLDGELKLNRNNGTEFKITFKELKYKKRT